MPNIKIYNADNDSGIITFNIEGIFAQDLATHFNAHNICVRSGQHCAKILLDYLEQQQLCVLVFIFITLKRK